MTILEQAHDTLLLGGIEIIETREIPHGWQLRGANGEVVNVYSTGKVIVQGRNAAAVKALLDARPPERSAVVKPNAPPEKELEEPEVLSRRPANWSDVWAEGDVPF